MPGYDRTGPIGYGPMTGRGLGLCRGLGFRRSIGRFRITESDEKKILEEELKEIELEKKEIEKRLKEVN